MDYRYDFHSYSKLYRQEALRDARERHLAKANQGTRSARSGVGFSLGSMLESLLRGARLAG